MSAVDETVPTKVESGDLTPVSEKKSTAKDGKVNKSAAPKAPRKKTSSSHAKYEDVVTSPDELPIDLNEPTYCVCHQVSFGDMIACDNDKDCQGGTWFHYTCVGLTPEFRFKGRWYCPTCRLLPVPQRLWFS